MNVSLTPALEKMVQKKVASGLYNSASEVIREALRLLEEQDRLRSIKLEKLRQDIAIGVEQADEGELIEGREAFKKLRSRHQKRSKKK